MTITTRSEFETLTAAAEFARTLRPGDVVALFGDLGAGKTAFVRGMATGRGYTGRVTSPTFNLVHVYDCVPPLYHYDLYRINGAEEMEEQGYYDALENGAILALEWAERIETALPPGYIRVTLTRDNSDDESRDITMEVTS